MTDQNELHDSWTELPANSAIDDMNEEQLRKVIVDSSKLWLAHDGLWFQSIEKDHGMDAAIKADTDAWKIFTKLEAKRILKRMGVEPGTGTIDDLAIALRHRLYANINILKIERSGNKLRMTMTDCRVQSARKRKNLDAFPCKSVAIWEYTNFALTVNPKFVTKCSYCPPDELPDDGYCQWEFTLED